MMNPMMGGMARPGMPPMGGPTGMPRFPGMPSFGQDMMGMGKSYLVTIILLRLTNLF